MKSAVDIKRVGDLRTLLGELTELHDNLAALIQDKIDAMKRADLQAMDELDGKQRCVAERIQEREGLRRQLMDAIGKGVGLRSRAGRSWSASQLAARLPSAEARPFLASATALRERV